MFLFVCFYLHIFTAVRLCLCSCPQGNVLSSAASVVLLSPRRATYCVTSSSIRGRNHSSVTCAATPAAGGTPSPAIYAPTRVSMESSPTMKTAALMGNVGLLGGRLYKRHDTFCSACRECSGLCRGKSTGCKCGITFFPTCFAEVRVNEIWGSEQTLHLQSLL